MYWDGQEGNYWCPSRDFALLYMHRSNRTLGYSLHMMGLRKTAYRQALHISFHVSFIVSTAVPLVSGVSLHLKGALRHGYCLSPAATVAGHM